jgi:hypothetical protein
MAEQKLEFESSSAAIFLYKSYTFGAGFIALRTAIKSGITLNNPVF